MESHFAKFNACQIYPLYGMFRTQHTATEDQ